MTTENPWRRWQWWLSEEALGEEAKVARGGGRCVAKIGVPAEETVATEAAVESKVAVLAEEAAARKAVVV